MKQKVNSDYQDRGMMKWQGFILHEMATELAEAEELVKNQLILGEQLDEDFWDENRVVLHS